MLKCCVRGFGRSEVGSLVVDGSCVVLCAYRIRRSLIARRGQPIPMAQLSSPMSSASSVGGASKQIEEPGDWKFVQSFGDDNSSDGSSLPTSSSPDPLSLRSWPSFVSCSLSGGLRSIQVAEPLPTYALVVAVTVVWCAFDMLWGDDR
jgi:hypothetical protein